MSRGTTGAVAGFGSHISVDRVPAARVAETYPALTGRFVPGLGGAHGTKPLATINAYLDELDEVVPAADRVLSALGPRMLELARDRAAGAYPFLVTPDYVASARAVVGAETRLPVLLTVVAEADPERAREIVRGGSLRFLSGQPATRVPTSSSSSWAACRTSGVPSCPRRWPDTWSIQSREGP